MSRTDIYHQIQMPACLHIIQTAQPGCTGIVRLVTGLASHCEPLGYSISVLFLADGPLVETVRDAGIQVSANSWTASRSDPAGAWRVWRWMRRHPAEIVHVHHGGVSVPILCRMAGARAVVQHLHSRILEPAGTPVSQRSFRAADAVVACSHSVADCFTSPCPEIIYAGIETGSHPPAPPDPGGQLTVGVLTRLIPLKNVEAVIKAGARLMDRGVGTRVEIAGTGLSEPALRELAKNLRMSDHVRFLGWQTDTESLLRSWSVLALPSFEEGLPMSVLEAMAAARPVVASRVGGLGELIVDGVTGRLVAAGDIEALAGCFAELAGDRQKLVQMGREGWKRAHKHFSAEVMARRTTEVYDRLLNRRSRFTV